MQVQKFIEQCRILCFMNFIFPQELHFSHFFHKVLIRTTPAKYFYCFTVCNKNVFHLIYPHFVSSVPDLLLLLFINAKVMLLCVCVCVGGGGGGRANYTLFCSGCFMYLDVEEYKILIYMSVITSSILF